MPRAKEPTTGDILRGPIAEIPIALLSDPAAGAAAKCVYMAIRYHTWWDTEIPTATIDQTHLMRDTGIPPSTFKRALAELQRIGWVAVISPADTEPKPVTYKGCTRSVHPDTERKLNIYLLLVE